MDALQQRLTAALADRYAIERELGRGGMATVYLARDVASGTSVAVKLLDPELAAAVGGERFRREVEIATRLAHPHIVPVIGAGEAAGSLFCVMPYMRGESLRAKLDREGPLPIDEALRLTCDVAGALEYAHAQGVVHRDIKPENLLLEDGHARVADFGLARAISATGEARLTGTGVTLGTPLYMSPEQSLAETTVDGRADIYSLGCVLYELLVGQPPFTGANAQAVMARHLVDVAPAVRLARSGVPDHVEDALRRALAKSPPDRFQNAREFADALRAPNTGRPSRDRVGAGGADRRRRLLGRVGLWAAAVVPIALIAYGVWTYLQPR